MFLNIRYLSIFAGDYFVVLMLTIYYRLRVHRSYHNGEDLENRIGRKIVLRVARAGRVAR